MSYFKDVFEMQRKFAYVLLTEFPKHVYEDQINCHLENINKFKNVFKIIPLIMLLFGVLFSLGTFLLAPIMFTVFIIMFIPLMELQVKHFNKFWKRFVYDGGK